MNTSLESRMTAAFASDGADLLAYLERRVAIREDAADLLGQTMVVAWRRVRKLPEDPEQARMWLFTIARNTLLNHGRGQRRAIAAAERLRSIIGAHNRPHDAVDDAIDVQGALATLEPHVAELVRLIHWEQFTIADAAALLGVSASTARGQYMRARTTLAKLLVDETVAEKNPG